jgi:hypothetical protein
VFWRCGAPNPWQKWKRLNLTGYQLGSYMCNTIQLTGKSMVIILIEHRFTFACPSQRNQTKPKRNQNETKMKPKWNQNETKMKPKRNWNETERNQITTKWNQYGTKMKPKWNQNETKMKPKHIWQKTTLWKRYRRSGPRWTTPVRLKWNKIITKKYTKMKPKWNQMKSKWNQTRSINIKYAENRKYTETLNPKPKP